jgi:hypothetical protein
MLKHFEEWGFSLRTLCLALQSTLRYGPGTGKQLPMAVPARRSRSANSSEPIGSEILLNVPDCFRNGTPDIDFPLDGDGFEPSVPLHIFTVPGTHLGGSVTVPFAKTDILAMVWSGENWVRGLRRMY